MKVKNKIGFFIISFLFFLVSCDGTYIFATIENEIKLKKASVEGTIHSIVKIDETLYVSNGCILSKKAFTNDTWKELSMPISGICTGIATNGTNLFASFIDNDNKSAGVYSYSSGNWNEVPNAKNKNITYVCGKGTVFGTSQKYTYTEGGKRESESVAIYEISDSGVSAPILEETNKNMQDGKLAHILAAGGSYFSVNNGVYDISGKIADSPGNVTAIDASGKYFLTRSNLYVNQNWDKKYSHGIEDPTDVSIITVNGTDKLFVSSNKAGYSEIIIDNTDISKSKTIKPDSEQYRSSVGKYATNVIFAEAKSQNEYYIYLGVNDSNYARYSGLWGYYSNGKREWNRE